MAWNEINILTTATHAETISEQLSGLGAQAVTLKDAGDQPLFEPEDSTPRIWPDTLVVGLFDEKLDLAPITAYLEKCQKNAEIKEFHVNPVADQDWVRQSLDSFKPIQVGKRLWICPSWQAVPDPTATTVVLDPGLAFGTGSHPTTALCLQKLETELPPNSVVMDYGSGSGILSIAALKLGAKRVIAVDHDPQALIATENNGLANGFDYPTLEVCLPEHIPEGLKVDVILANILAQPLVTLAPLFAQYAKHGTKIFLSGILSNQISDLEKAYSKDFFLQPAVFKEDWAILVGVKK